MQQVQILTPPENRMGSEELGDDERARSEKEGEGREVKEKAPERYENKPNVSVHQAFVVGLCDTGVAPFLSLTYIVAFHIIITVNRKDVNQINFAFL